MNHKMRDNISGNLHHSFSARKIGLLSVPIAIAMLVVECNKKVENIFHLGTAKHPPESVLITSKRTPEEAERIAAGWSETSEDQVLKSYHIRKGDTLLQLVEKHGVTLESILKVNPKITTPGDIYVGQIVLVPYDGYETTTPETLKTAGAPVPLSFTKQSLLTMMRDILTRPEGKLLGAIGNQPSDVSRLKVIGEKTGLGGHVKDVRYANLCAANMRAVGASLKYYLQSSGTDIDLGWNNGKNGIGVGKYFADLSSRHQLPKGYQVITTKGNPDIAKLKDLLLNKGKEYSVFVISYEHDVDGHVNMAFRVGNDIIIFDPSWRGNSAGWPERFHRFEDYMNHFVLGNKTSGYTGHQNRYDLYNIACVPAHHVDVKGMLVHGTLTEEKTHNNDSDMRNLTMVFEGFTPRMKIDTQDKNKITYAIGYGTNVGTMQAEYPFASYGKEVAEYLVKKGHSKDAIREIMKGEQDITRSEACGLFEMRYVPRYQKIRTICGKNWNKYPPVIRNMLVDMSYNMGESAIFPSGNNPGFPHAVAALNRGDWVGYINAVVDSKYARDVGPRRLGKWVALIIKDVVKGRTSRFSSEALDMHATYNTKHSRDLSSQMEKLD